MRVGLPDKRRSVTESRWGSRCAWLLGGVHGDFPDLSAAAPLRLIPTEEA